MDCQNGGTLNGGNCTCSCADGYSGASCEGVYVCINFVQFCVSMSCKKSNLSIPWHLLMFMTLLFPHFSVFSELSEFW